MSQIDAQTFGNELRKLRSERGLTLVAVAVLVGVDFSTVSRWESGDRTPTPQHVVTLAKALGVSVARFTP